MNNSTIRTDYLYIAYSFDFVITLLANFIAHFNSSPVFLNHLTTPHKA